jgi:hypothetical protein
MLMIVNCTKPAPDPNVPVTVTEVLRNIHSWDGKIVTVDGWLGNCSGFSCHIHETLDDAELLASGRAGWDNAIDRALGVGGGKEFDVSAESMQFNQVRLKARVSDECRGWGLCYDRSPDLHPISIRQIRSNKDS